MCVVEKGKLLFLPLLDLRRLDLGLGRRRDADLPGPLHGDLLAVFGRHRLARPERERINWGKFKNMGSIRGSCLNIGIIRGKLLKY